MQPETKVQVTDNDVKHREYIPVKCIFCPYLDNCLAEKPHCSPKPVDRNDL